MRLPLLFTCLTLVGLFPACSGEDSDDAGTGGASALHPDCQAIVDTCMPKDDGSNPTVHDCHHLGHDGPAAQCTQQKQSCVATCTAAPTPDGGMGGTAGMAGMAGVAGMAGTAGMAGVGGK